jgi:hypothetical protein
MNEELRQIESPANQHSDIRKPEPETRVQVEKPSALLSVERGDPTLLAAIVDRTASRKKIIDDLRRALPKFAVPYRKIQPDLLQAIRLTLTENMTFEQASIRVYGTPKHAGAIRYWRNRWELQ